MIQCKSITEKLTDIKKNLTGTTMIYLTVDKSKSICVLILAKCKLKTIFLYSKSISNFKGTGKQN